MGDYRELSQDEQSRLKHIVEYMQGLSRDLSDLFDEQQYRGSEAEILHSLSLRIMDRYGMLPGQPYHPQN